MNLPGQVLDSIAVAFWAAFLSSAVLAYPIYRLLVRLKSRQTIYEYAPESHQTKQGTPTMGGLIVIAGFLVAAGALLRLEMRAITMSAVVLFLGFALIGLLDDFIIPKLMHRKRGLGWKQKLILEVLVAGYALWVHGGMQFDARWGLALFIVLFVANAYNFADGLDALAGSLLLVLCGGLIVLSMAGLVVPEPAVICAALIGAVLPFLFLNAPPAKVFMGDVGSLPVGAVLGLAIATILAPRTGALDASAPIRGSVQSVWEAQLAIEGIPWRPEMAVPLLILCLILVVELVPVPLQIAWVKLFKRRLFPFTPIHHAFEKAGWPESRVVWTFALTQIVLVALALRAYQLGPQDSVAPMRSVVEARR